MKSYEEYLQDYEYYKENLDPDWRLQNRELWIYFEWSRDEKTYFFDYNHVERLSDLLKKDTELFSCIYRGFERYTKISKQLDKEIEMKSEKKNELELDF